MKSYTVSAAFLLAAIDLTSDADNFTLFEAASTPASYFLPWNNVLNRQVFISSRGGQLGDSRPQSFGGKSFGRSFYQPRWSLGYSYLHRINNATA